MTSLGVFARSFQADTPEELARLIARVGFDTAQLNLTAVGRPTLDAHLSREGAAQIAAAFERGGVKIWGLSGTFNAIHPDPLVRRENVAACRALIALAPIFGVEAVTLCTGTRDPDDMWRAHPDNSSEAAWRDMRETLDPLLSAARESGVRLGIEPETGNVVRDAGAAARLLQEVGSDADHLTIVLDPANLLSMSTLSDQDRILRDAFDRLGPHVGCLHAKDVVPEGHYAASGAGGLDYPLVMELHSALPNDVPVIAQDLSADDAARVFEFLRDALDAEHR